MDDAGRTADKGAARMRRRAAACTVVLAFAAAAVPGVTAAYADPSAARATASAPAALTGASLAAVARPRLTTRRTAGHAGAPVSLTWKLTLPVLTGVPRARAAAFATAINRMIAADRRALRVWRGGCYATSPPAYRGPSYEQSTWSGSVYAGRFASVVVDFLSNPGCGGVNSTTPYSITIDLRTGRTMSLAQVALRNGTSLDWAVIAYLKSQNGGCVRSGLTPRGTGSDPLPAFRAWTVSSRGVGFWFGRGMVGFGYCDSRRALVPWNHILRPGTPPVAVTSRSLVSDAYGSAYMIVTVRGHRVTAFYAGDGAACLHGTKYGSSLFVYWDSDGFAYSNAWVGSGTSLRRAGWRLPRSAAERAIFTGSLGRTAEQICGL